MGRGVGRLSRLLASAAHQARARGRALVLTRVEHGRHVVASLSLGLSDGH